MKLVPATVAVIALGTTVAPLTGAIAAYPDRPIRFVVPFAPGGPSDILSRLVGQKLGESLGQTIVIDNRGSVGGILGAEIAAKAPGDGYTLLLTANSLLTINPHVYKKLPYDPVRELQPITQLTQGGNVVVVHPSVPAKNIKDLIALAKAKPGAINYATTGTGPLLAIANFKAQAGIDMVGVAYKGTGQAVIALLGNEVQMFFMNPLVAVPHVKAGKLNALAVTSLDRNPAVPDLPTVAESGLPGFKNITWHSVQAPATMPQALVTRLNGELVRIVKMPDVQARFKGDGLTGVGSTPAEVRELAKQETMEYAQLVKKIGLQPQ